jgi:hypothetical protein
MKCENCDSPLRATAKVCISCGTPVSAPEVETGPAAVLPLSGVPPEGAPSAMEQAATKANSNASAPPARTEVEHTRKTAQEAVFEPAPGFEIAPEVMHEVAPFSWGATKTLGLVAAGFISLIFILYFVVSNLMGHAHAPPAAPAQDRAVGTESGPQFATRMTHVRDAPTSIGSTILEDIQGGEAVSGIWVLGRNGVTKWLRIQRRDGSSAYLWGTNLAAVRTTTQPASDRARDFGAYPATPYPGPIAPPNWRADTKFANFRTAITQGAAGGVNYAGHYAIVRFGCGTDCSSGFLVDEMTGQIFDFPLGGESFYDLALEYRPDSNLLVAQWQDNQVTPVCVHQEFVIASAKFDSIRKEIQPGACPQMP